MGLYSLTVALYEEKDVAKKNGTITIPATHASPGSSVFYPIHHLKRPAKEVNWDEWGICEYGCNFWVGNKAFIAGENILRVSLLEVFDKKDEEYPEWEDKETFLLVGRDKNEIFRWCVLNREELQEMVAKVQSAN